MKKLVLAMVAGLVLAGSFVSCNKKSETEKAVEAAAAATAAAAEAGAAAVTAAAEAGAAAVEAATK